MDRARFWQLIEASQNKKRDCDKQAAKLEKLLSGLSAQEILGFENIFTSLLSETYRWDLWGAAYIISGGCSNDCFEYFRYWLIAQGQAYFEAAIQAPERAGDAANEDLDFLDGSLFAMQRVLPTSPRQVRISGKCPTTLITPPNRWANLGQKKT